MKFHFPIDSAHNKANNEYYRDTRRLQIASSIFAALLMIGGILVLSFSSRTTVMLVLGIGLILIGLLYVAVTFSVRKQVKDPQELYDSSPLVPAMIAKVNERTMVLMALVDTRKNPEVGAPRQALALRTVTTISGVPRRIGARVPAVAVGGAHKSKTEYYDEITPVPIAWATRQTGVIRRAENEIPGSDWALLKDSIARVDEVQKTPRDLLTL